MNNTKFVITYIKDIGSFKKQYWDAYAFKFIDKPERSCHFGSHSSASTHLPAINAQIHGGLVQVEPVLVEA